MRNKEVFWGTVLLAVGALLLLGRLVGFNMWQLIGPLFLIAFGLWIVLASTGERAELVTEEIAVPLEGAERAEVRISHGAGELSLRAGADDRLLMGGRFVGGLDYQVDRRADGVSLNLRPRAYESATLLLPWRSWRRRGLSWDMTLHDDIPLALTIETGAASANLDLTRLQVRELVLKTGVSSTELVMPAAAGRTRARIETGVSSVNVRIPDGVAAQIRVSSGLASVDVDRQRFVPNGLGYRSEDYETAENRLDLEINTGVGSVNVR